MKKYISEYTITQLSKCKLLITGKIKALYYVKSYHVDDFTIPSLILSSFKFKGDCVVVVRFVQKLTGMLNFFAIMFPYSTAVFLYFVYVSRV